MEMQKIQNDQNNTDFKIYHKSWQFLSSPRINKKYISTKYLQKNFQNSCIHNGTKHETIQTSINRIMDKPIVSMQQDTSQQKKKKRALIYKNMDESHICVLTKKVKNTKMHILYNFIYMKFRRKTNLKNSERAGCKKMGWNLKGTERIFWVLKLNLNRSMGYSS